MAQPLRYFSKIRLRNKATGKYLAATKDHYTATWSDKDQTALDLVSGDTPETQWIMRPPCGLDFLKAVGEEIAAASQDGESSVHNVVRFLSPLVEHHLHSHEKAAPLAEEEEDRREVTLYAKDHGVGDQNDNWRIHVIATKRATPYPRVALKHAATGGYLASDGKLKYTGKSGEERTTVWTQPEIDDATTWVVIADEDQQPPFVPDIVASFQSNESKVVYRTLEDARQDVASFLKAYESLISTEYRNTEIYNLYTEFSPRLTAISRYLADVEDVDSYENYELKLGVFRGALADCFEEGRLPHPTTANFRFIESLRKTSGWEAGFALMQMLDMGIDKVDGTGVAGLVKLALYQRGEVPIPGPDIQKLSEDLSHQRAEWETLSATAKGAIQTAVSSAGDFLHRAKANQSTDAAAFEADMNRIRESFRGQEISESPGHYWKEKKTRHRTNVGRLAFAFIVSLGLSIGGLIWAFFFHFPKPGENGLQPADYLFHYTLPVAALASLAIWGIKAISRNLVSQIHMASDANERETMLLTFRALLKDGDKPLGDEEKKIIVAIVFRPGGNGLGDEGSGPTFIWESLFRKGDG